MDELDPAADGTWLVTTETATYQVDLDADRIQRHPRTDVAEWQMADDGIIVERRDFPSDGQRMPLVALRCRIGRPILAVVATGGGLGVLTSTPVQRISRQAQTPVDPGSSDTRRRTLSDEPKTDSP